MPGDASALEALASKSVSYFYDEVIGDHNLGAVNPMRPHRVRLTTKLLEGYRLTAKMRVHRPRELSYDELNTFHCDGARPRRAARRPARRRQRCVAVQRSSSPSTPVLRHARESRPRASRSLDV